MIMTMTTQYFDMLRDIGTARNSNTFFLPNSGQNDITAQMREALLSARPPPRPQTMGQH
jgi:hypothetical protein